MSFKVNSNTENCRSFFLSEIRQAPGHLSSFEAASQIILFSEEEFVLKKIAEHDLEKGDFLF